MGGHFDVSKLNIRLQELEKIVNQDNFWDNYDYANSINEEYGTLKKKLDKYNTLIDEVDVLELLKKEMPEDEYNIEYSKLNAKIKELEILTHLNGLYDSLNCYLEIHPGAGGTESCDWADMLARMYMRFCERYHYEYEIIYENKGDIAGIKAITILIKGPYAYGYLKRENGIHRLVRISPFDANKRRHTSFASVTITPEFKETPDLEIKESDLKIDVYHSSGAGGQSVNTSNSAVRITHLPTKTVVTCQNERSQLKNKELAMKILKNKIYELKIKEQQLENDKIKDNNLNIEFGNQIRSYILEPYKLVKDSRSGYENSDPSKILDGEIFAMLEFNIKNIKWNK